MSYADQKKRFTAVGQSSFRVLNRKYAIKTPRFKIVLRKAGESKGAGIYAGDHWTILDTVTGNEYTACSTGGDPKSTRASMVDSLHAVEADFKGKTGFFASSYRRGDKPKK